MPTGAAQMRPRTTRNLPTRLLGIFALALVGVLALPPAALAGVLEPDNVAGTYSQNGEVLDSSDSIDQYSVVQFDVTFDLPSSATAGDTFSIAIPPQFQGYRDTFNLTHGADVVATCEPTPDTGRVSGYECTLTDWADTEDVFTGFSMHFEMQAILAADAGSPGVEVGGVPVEFPSAILAQSTDAPSASFKDGYIDPATGHVIWEWVILFPQGATSATVTDLLPEGTTFVGIQTVQLRELDRWTEYYPSNDPFTRPTVIGEGGPTGYTQDVADVGGRDELTMTIPVWDPYDAALVSIETEVDAGVAAGSTFENTAQIVSNIPGEQPQPDEIEGETTWDWDAGGSGGGDSVDLELSKVVTGEGAATGATFEVELACSDSSGTPFDGSPWEYSLVPGTPIRIPDIGAGSSCTVTESAESASGASVSYAPSQTFTLTADQDLLVEVTVTNDYPAPPVGFNLTLTKELIGADTVAPGDVVEFSLVPHNDGPASAAAGWAITDLLRGDHPGRGERRRLHLRRRAMRCGPAARR